MTRGVGRRILGTECAQGHWAGSSCRWLMRDGGPRAPRPARLDKQWRARGATRRDPRRRSTIGCRHARAANGGVSWRSRRDARTTISGQPHHRQAPPPRRWPLVRADTDEAKEPLDWAKQTVRTCASCPRRTTRPGVCRRCADCRAAWSCVAGASHRASGPGPDASSGTLRSTARRRYAPSWRPRPHVTYVAAQHRRGAPATAGGLIGVGRAAGPAPRGAYPWYRPTSARTRAACARDADRRGAVGGAPRRSASLAASLLREALRGA